MARPPRLDPAHLRDQVLAIARREVLAHGPSGLSLRAIARELGYSPGALYRYVDGRQAIVDALRAEAAEALAQPLRAALEHPGEDPPLVALGLAAVQACHTHADATRLAQALSSRRSLAEPIPATSPYRLVVQAVEQAVAAGLVRADSPRRVEEIAYAFWGLAEGLVALRLGHLRDFDDDLRHADRQAFEALLRGFARQDAS